MENNKMVKAITSQSEDFASWYTDVVREAKLCEYSSVKGCLNYLPNGYAIWENIKNSLDKRFKETGVENVYLPVLIPESLLQKEKEHIEGFAPEVATVTHGGGEELEEKLCIRPTSETLFCDIWQHMVKSYRDLPLVWNQWNSVLRWEKTTRPFLRSREFLWQEGHTLHATPEEAEERTKQMLDIYYDFVTNDLAIPLIKGQKTESEKFAGAEATYTIESMMKDGKALQSGTSHFFGNGFPDAFNIKYLDKENKLHSAYETSWGLSTRIIGALIMVHGDDNGLVLPPKIAPTQVMIIPIAQHKDGVLEYCNDLLNKLKENNIRVKLDATDKTPGYKFSQQEVLGIPLRIEAGPRDIENNQVVITRRDNGEKITVSVNELVDKVNEIIVLMQKEMFDRANDLLNKNIRPAHSIDEINEIDKENKGFIKAMWCGDEKCEDKIKNDTNGYCSRCIPFEQEIISDKCVCCGEHADTMVIWAKSY